MQYCVNSCNLFYRKTQKIKMSEDYLNMTIGTVLKKLEQSVPDTEHSKRIFDVEEGEQDKCFQSISTSNSGRRDWIILWEIYGRKSENLTESPNQKFHLKNYLEFKLQNGLHLSDNFYVFCYRYISNSALIIYIREIIFDESRDALDSVVEQIISHYKQGNKINSSSRYAKRSTL